MKTGRTLPTEGFTLSQLRNGMLHRKTHGVLMRCFVLRSYKSTQDYENGDRKPVKKRFAIRKKV